MSCTWGSFCGAVSSLRLLQVEPMFGLRCSEHQASPKDLKGPLTKFALVIYYLPCLAGAGLVAWLSDVLNCHGETCHLTSCT